jgi:hypothetical protein
VPDTDPENAIGVALTGDDGGYQATIMRVERTPIGQPVVISEKSPFDAVCAGQQVSPEVVLER